MLSYGSVCSGIESASVAWEPLGFSPTWFAEIEGFPSAVLAHHWPHVPNLGDMTQLARWVRFGLIPAPDVLVGGTPCQSYSVAGKRLGLSDPRGQLTLSYVDLLNAIDEQRPNNECVCVWENVPGVLSDAGNAFGEFLGKLVGECEPLQPSGGKWPNAGCVFGPQRSIAWRVIDAQYFGVAQRRRRVFVVGSARDGFDPAEVLFESEGVRRDSPPSRDARQGTAKTASGSSGIGSHWDDLKNPHPSLTQSHNTGGVGASNQEIFSQRGSGIVPAAFRMVAFGEYSDDNTASTMKARDYKDHTDLAVMSVHGTQDPCVSLERAHALGRNNGGENAICVTGDTTHALKAEGFDASEGGTGRGQPIVAAHAFDARQSDVIQYGDFTGPLDTCGFTIGVQQLTAVRRLTPTECERLQGFPDGHTLVPYRNKPAADGPRYKALGNSKAVPCIRWIGERIKNALRETTIC